MPAQEPDLTPQQERCIELLLLEHSRRAVAEQVGISERTLRSWLADPTFAAAFREARRQLSDAGIDVLRRGVGAACKTLLRNLTAAKDSDQIRAAKAILDTVFKGNELQDVTEQLRQLQKVVDDIEATRQGGKS